MHHLPPAAAAAREYRAAAQTSDSNSRTRADLFRVAARVANRYGLHARPDKAARVVFEEPTTKPIEDRIARTFAQLLISELTRDQMRKVLTKNRGRVIECASHEYLDADDLMNAAFALVVGRDATRTNQRDAEIWSTAWQAARRAEFWVR